MKEQLYFREDKDIETGHGWMTRELEDGEYLSLEKDKYLQEPSFKVKICSPEYEPLTARHAGCSYWWIFNEKEPAKSRTIRRRDMPEGFLGCDDMESHFEIGMLPEAARKYLKSLGMIPLDESDENEV